MDDKTMLELAAKAAGIKAPFDDKWGGMLIPVTVHESYDGLEYWNPLTSDGDALRLAVKLRLECVYAPTDIGPVSCQYWIGGEGFKSAVEEINGDPCAATRRAIVRAAAAIGSASHD